MFIGCQAVFKPADRAALKAAVGTCQTTGSYPNYLSTCTGGCLGEDATGGCPIFIASIDTTNNPYGPIGDWDVSAVTDMESMFLFARTFNQDISGWDVSSVTNFKYMFVENYVFNQDLSSWDVSKAMHFDAFFSGTTVFTSDLSGWNVSSAINMLSMFKRTQAFNSDISTWDVSKVTTMNKMFENSVFNQDLSKWDVLAVTDMENMFLNSGLDQTLCWDTLSSSAMSPWGNVGSSTARYGCCDAGSYMSKPHLNPFSKATACEACPVGQYGSTVNDDDITSCENCPSGQSTLAPGSTTDECFTALEIKAKFVSSPDPDLVPAYNIANSCG